MKLLVASAVAIEVPTSLALIFTPAIFMQLIFGPAGSDSGHALIAALLTWRLLVPRASHVEP